MKILIDMNLPPRWIQVFAAAGSEAVHWSQVGSPTASDRDIMAWAEKMVVWSLPTILIFLLCWRLRKKKDRA
jgi:predicted nuclease of predicted toxin-antitoxin system